ncbi:DNA cytosine methyltransferase [Nocardiopsis chromatogenes]|uniref:DNA cytosine methyltransferase n=1 Tax=Nocardiopsis chromatogenes TaxID=280239 RepID=UPI0003486B16|nr:DNA cytosine methyltransferase [Nocardiopsis chromatogenes]
MLTAHLERTGGHGGHLGGLLHEAEGPLAVGSLCTGIAGLDLGALRAIGAAELVWAADNDPDISVFLRARLPDVPNHGDIRGLDWDRVQPVDVLTAGFPCQDISISGRAAGIREGTRSGLWTAVVQAVRHLRPRLLLVEQVAALRWRDRGLGRLLGDLARIGYDARWCSLRASDVGAPHPRERVFIAAHPHRQGRREGPLLGGRPQEARQAGLTARCNPAVGRDESGGGWVQQELFPPPPPSREGGFGALPPAPRNDAAEDEGEGCPLRRLGAWGSREAVIRRWEHITGYPAPCPLEPGQRGGRRLNPAFSEWAMGFTPGWITDPDLGLERNAQLKAIGNAVVPQQAHAAAHLLINDQPPTGQQ